MKWWFPDRGDSISARLRSIDGRISEIEREIRALNRIISRPQGATKREDIILARGLGQSVLPESKKRFISYLSTGSFQTIGLRKHEQRSARIKGVLLAVAVILIVILLLYYFTRALLA